ncbi:MAG TPA: signal recognition particle-docking protein FtsY [Candidatus Nanoarchaeia archaeon]|nr:signal recognition particle-docking protein FtsY [Candidatus Nanoarchaeia archaeon]
MFKFLKEKLKSAISSISRRAEEEAEVIEKPKEKKPAKKEEAKKEKPKKEARKAEKPKAAEKKQRPRPEIKEKKEKPQPAEKIPDKKKEIKEEIEEAEEKKGFFGRLKERFAKKEEETEEKEEPEEEKEAEEEKEEVQEEEEKPEATREKVQEEEEEPEKRGFFARVKEAVSTKVLSEKQFEEMFEELQMALLENNVAWEVVEKIKGDMRQSLVDKRIERGKFENIIGATLHDSISSLFDIERINLIKEIKGKKPYIIVFVGVNGSGKTTTIAKIAKLMQNSKLKPVIAASDTFRAAAIQQLEEHGSRLGVKVIKHDYGSDPAAVAFDAIKYAESKGLDVVLIDTAGRQHSNVNLMDEMKKIVRVSKPNLKVFIGESITGNDCIEQAKSFNEAIGIDAIVLTKADVDEKGGAAVSVSYVTGKPILFIGMGQGYEDLKEFDKKLIMENLGLA